jgi:hypothetical protein
MNRKLINLYLQDKQNLQITRHFHSYHQRNLIDIITYHKIYHQDIVNYFVLLGYIAENLESETTTLNYCSMLTVSIVTHKLFRIGAYITSMQDRSARHNCCVNIL